MCPGGLPTDCTLLWQAAQLPRTSLCSKLITGRNANGRVAGLAAIRTQDMRCGLAGGADARAGGVAGRADPWRGLEYAVHVAAFAAHVAMCAGQLEAGRQVIEGCRGGRRRPMRGCPAAAQRTSIRVAMDFHGHSVTAVSRDGTKWWNDRSRSACRTGPDARHRWSDRTCSRVPAWPRLPAACGRYCTAVARARRSARNRSPSGDRIARRSRHWGCGSAGNPRPGCPCARHQTRGSRRTSSGASLNRCVSVAARAGHGHVLSDQRKAGQVVVEADVACSTPPCHGSCRRSCPAIRRGHRRRGDRQRTAGRASGP